jgi:hypothetical protein
LESKGQIELETLRLFGLPEAAPAVLYACPAVPIGTRSLALDTTWDLPSLRLPCLVEHSEAAA